MPHDLYHVQYPKHINAVMCSSHWSEPGSVKTQPGITNQFNEAARRTLRVGRTRKLLSKCHSHLSAEVPLGAVV